MFSITKFVMKYFYLISGRNAGSSNSIEEGESLNFFYKFCIKCYFKHFPKRNSVKNIKNANLFIKHF